MPLLAKIQFVLVSNAVSLTEIINRCFHEISFQGTNLAVSLLKR
jgi:hypothetical protein